jgi:alpha-methylacyl-CoA racemase
VFAGSDACVAPVLTWREARDHPQLRERQTLVERHGIVQPSPAPRFSRTKTSLSAPPQRAGQNSREALQAWGITDLDELIATGVVIQADASSL